MYERLCQEMQRYVREDGGNRFPASDQPYFDAPLIGVAAADDPIWREYRQVIGPFHRTPDELLPGASAVIVWVLPISRATRESNRRENQLPSLAWAQTRSFGDDFLVVMRRHLVDWLEARGYRALAPQLEPNWQRLSDSPVGLASTWSERHAAYAAGLGTFSLSDGLITPRGIAHRVASVVTDCPLAPTVSERPHHLHNCLYHRNGNCGACIARCPVGAISRAGHDKERCGAYVYGPQTEALARQYGVAIAGCGLCQTKVPCEQQIPADAPHGRMQR